MLNLFREIVSLLLFSGAIFFMVLLFITGFSWLYIGGLVACILASFYLWPSKKRGQREGDNWFLNILEVLIELPVEVCLWLIRRSLRLLSELFEHLFS